MNMEANDNDGEQNISEGIKNSLKYPFIIIGMMFVVILVLVIKVLPIFNQVFIQLGSEMTGFSKGMMQFGNLVGTYSIVFISILIALFALYWFFLRTEKGRTVRSLSAENNLETIPEGYKWIESTDGLGGYILNKVWTVTFELVDGTYPAESGITVEEGKVVVEDVPDFSKFSEVKLSKDPVREHYSFDGWLLENEKAAADYEITADTTFYASWIGEEVIILISDGMGHELNRAVKPYGTTMTAEEFAELITDTADLDDDRIEALCEANEGYTLDEAKLWSPELPTADVTIEPGGNNTFSFNVFLKKATQGFRRQTFSTAQSI